MRQFSSLYLTLVSVLVGPVFSHLYSEAHEGMTLWPLTLETPTLQFGFSAGLTSLDTNLPFS